MSMDVLINLEYPGVEFIPAAPELHYASGYHEDREITTTLLTGSQMWRTYNAKYNKSTNEWSYGDSSKSAYALVQNPDGSLHFFSYSGTAPWGLAAWTGSGNNTVFNAVDYGLTVLDLIGTANTGALQLAVDAAIAAGGGTVYIPEGTYLLKGSVILDGKGVTAGLVIKGTSGASELFQQTADDIFTVKDWNGGWGIRFQFLRLRYATGLIVGLPFAAITASSTYTPSACENIVCEAVYFLNCPTAFAADNRTLQCGLVDCTIDYNNFPGTTMIELLGSQDGCSASTNC
jgi:hypothetical protein